MRASERALGVNESAEKDELRAPKPNRHLAIALDDTREPEQCTALPLHYLFEAIPLGSPD
jgi:hypothetical protein